jgi:hypothetical protein
MKSLRRVLPRLLLGCGLLAFGGGWSGCPGGDSSSLCEQACVNSAEKCGAGSSSSSGTTQDCIAICDSGIGSKSGSSGAAYRDMLSCVASASSCLEIQNVCGL